MEMMGWMVSSFEKENDENQNKINFGLVYIFFFEKCPDYFRAFFLVSKF
jgi:hypothetical protein